VPTRCPHGAHTVPAWPPPQPRWVSHPHRSHRLANLHQYKTPGSRGAPRGAISSPLHPPFAAACCRAIIAPLEAPDPTDRVGSPRGSDSRCRGRPSGAPAGPPPSPRPCACCSPSLPSRGPRSPNSPAFAFTSPTRAIGAHFTSESHPLRVARPRARTDDRIPPPLPPLLLFQRPAQRIWIIDLARCLAAKMFLVPSPCVCA